MHIMQKIRHALLKEPQSYNNKCCGLPAVWISLDIQYVYENQKIHRPQKRWLWQGSHLSLSNISVDKHNNTRLLRVNIKQSKVFPFRQGVSIYLGATGKSICPVAGILPYLAACGNHQGPLFTTEDGSGLTRKTFATLISSFLSKLDLNTKHYYVHSFRIGAATSAAEACIPNASIKMLGRWQSDAYHHYIKTPPHDLTKLIQRAGRKSWTMYLALLFVVIVYLTVTI